MNFKEIDLSIPEDIKVLANAVESIREDSVLAGGFLSDIYMNKPFKEVDFFIKSSGANEEQFFKKLESKITLSFIKLDKSSNHYRIEGIRHVFRAKYKDYTVNFIFSSHGERAPYFFDIKMREFYYQKGKTYATDEALEDIKNKEIKAGALTDVVSSLYRIFLFKERYNFSINKKHLEMFTDAFICSDFDLYNAQEFFREENNLSVSAKEEMKTYLTKLQFKKREFHVKKSAFLYLCTEKKMTLTRALFQKIYFFEETYEKEIKLTIPKSYFLEKLDACETEIKKEFKKQSVRLSLLYPSFTKEIHENIDNWKFFHFSFLPKMDELITENSDTLDFLKHLHECIASFNRLAYALTKIKETLYIRLSEDDVFSNERYDIEKILNREHLLIEIYGFTNLVWSVKDNKPAYLESLTFNIFYDYLAPFLEKAREDMGHAK